MRTKPTIAALLLALAALPACRTGAAGRVVDPETGRASSIDVVADELASADVVFLGEEHDNDVGHELQFALTRALHLRRPNLVLALEQFEADVQVFLDAYLAGALDEEVLLDVARPWPNYARHYRPAVEWAEAHSVPVVAANVPRRLARTVAYRGLGTTDWSLFSPWETWTDEPAYLERFLVAMGGSPDEAPSAALERWFAAQCLKDAMMAQSIAAVFDRAEEAGEERPLVVHWCGRFHSDYGLGTVSRVARRRPDLDLRVVSMVSGADTWTEIDGRPIADWVLRVPEQPREGDDGQ